MNTKIVYALTSDESDIFLEQLIVSSYTLKQYNPNCVATLVVDDKTNNTLKGDRVHIMDYLDEIIVVNTPNELNKKQRSRFIKTSLREQVKGDYLFIDNDTLITGSLENADNFCEDVLAVLDRHVRIEDSFEKARIIEQCSKAGHPMNNPEDNDYFNSGVMFVRDSEIAHRLYEAWHRHWNENRLKLGLNIDQPALALANREMGYVIKELSGIWNCQITGNGLKDLQNAIVLHYFNSNLNNENVSPCFYFSNANVYWNIKRNNCTITQDVMTHIESPKSAFERSCDILVGDNQRVFHDIVVRFVFDQYYHHKSMYRFIYAMVNLYSKARDFIRNRSAVN